MNRTKLAILSILTSVSLGVFVFGTPKEAVSSYAYTNGDAATYYSSIDKYDSGSTLTSKLNTLNNQKRQRLIPYNSLFNYFDETDPPSGYGKVTAFYSGKSISSGITREHVWPYSRLYLNGTDSSGKRTDEGKNEIEQDLQMVRPCYSGDNEGRGNAFFTMPDGQGWDPGSLGIESYRGDSARIIFYCAIADLNLTLVDKDYDNKDNHTMGKLSTLLEWNLKYPVLKREKNRNEAVESIQGHRNPFIDHPEYACRIWGNYNGDTKSVCASYGFEGQVKINNSDVINEEYLLEVDENATFAASFTGTATPTYNWSFSTKGGTEQTTDIASITGSGSSISVKGLKVGTTYLKLQATYTMSNGATDTVFRTVKLNVVPRVDVTSIQLTNFPNKISYYVGDTFDPTGIKIVATYDDGSTSDVTNKVTYLNTNFDSAGTKTVFVKYQYKDVTVETSFNVFVREQGGGGGGTPSSSGGCGGSIMSTSIILSSLSLISALLITVSLRKKKKK